MDLDEVINSKAFKQEMANTHFELDSPEIDMINERWSYNHEMNDLDKFSF